MLTPTVSCIVPVFNGERYLQEALASLVHLSLFKHYLLSSQFDAWHGLFQSPTYWTPIVRAVWVTAIFAGFVPSSGASRRPGEAADLRLAALRQEA